MFRLESTLADLGQRLVHRLAVSATTVLIMVVSGASAAPQSADSEQLLSAPNQSDGDSSKRGQIKSSKRPATALKTDEQSKDWTSSLNIAPNSEAYWSTFGTDLSTDFGGGDRLKKFQYAPALHGSTNSFDRFKLGDSYLGVETQRRMTVPVPWQSANCGTVEDCEDYSGLPKAKAPSSTGSGSAIGRLRKPFIGLSITTPIQ